MKRLVVFLLIALSLCLLISLISCSKEEKTVKLDPAILKELANKGEWANKVVNSDPAGFRFLSDRIHAVGYGCFDSLPLNDGKYQLTSVRVLSDTFLALVDLSDPEKVTTGVVCGFPNRDDSLAFNFELKGNKFIINFSSDSSRVRCDYSYAIDAPYRKGVKSNF